MNVKTTLKITALAASVLATALLGAANPQVTDSVRFTLPFAVRWSGVTLQAGDYTLTMDRTQSAAIVRSTSGGTHFIPQIPTASDLQPGGAFIFVTASGGQHVVRYLNLPRLGGTLVYQPLTKAEQKELAKGGLSHAEPIALAEN